MTKAILPINRKKLKSLATVIKAETERVAKNYYQAELQRVVNPLKSDIKIDVTSKKDNDDWTVKIHGKENDTASINAVGDGVSSHDLLMWLDAGTSVNYAFLPSDFENETSPGSLATSRKEYDRERIYVNTSTAGPGIQARKWLEQINNLYKHLIRNNINRVTKAYLDG